MSLPLKKQTTPYDMALDMKTNINTPVLYDNNSLPVDIIKRVASKMAVNPGILLSSAWQEGMNQAVVSPDNVSIGYNEANVPEEYPVDGFRNYGLDTIGDRYKQLSSYLPQGFEKNMFLYKTTNEKNQPINTAAFKTNEDALTAKAAFMKMEADRVNHYAEVKGIELDEQAQNYFMLASYNAGYGSALKMMDEYKKSKDKKKFIEKGETSLKGVHKNIKVRLDNTSLAESFLNAITK